LIGRKRMSFVTPLGYSKRDIHQPFGSLVGIASGILPPAAELSATWERIKEAMVPTRVSVMQKVQKAVVTTLMSSMVFGSLKKKRQNLALSINRRTITLYDKGILNSFVKRFNQVISTRCKA
jgi:hypothetical protein